MLGFQRDYKSETELEKHKETMRYHNASHGQLVLGSCVSY